MKDLLSDTIIASGLTYLAATVIETALASLDKKTERNLQRRFNINGYVALAIIAAGTIIGTI